MCVVLTPLSVPGQSRRNAGRMRDTIRPALTMNVFAKAAQSLRLTAMRFAGRLSSWGPLLLPNTNRDYARLVGNGTNSSVAMACILWVARTFPEAPIRVQTRQPDDTLVPQRDHPMTLLIERPNPFYGGQLLWMSTITDLLAEGNAYWIKVRGASKRVVQLWYVPASLMQPEWPDDGSAYLSQYRYKPDLQSDPIILDPNDVVHFRYGIDPLNTRKGRSPLATVLREIYTDDEAANFSATVLGNLGIPGVIISPEAESTPDEARAVKAAYTENFGGDRRGSTMVTFQPTKVQVLSWSPQQLNLRDLRRIPEERVSAVFGVAAIVAGLGAGLDRSTFSNFGEAREASYESNIIPLQRLIASEIYAQLLPDFSTDSNIVVDFDISGIRILQEDENAKVTRLGMELNDGAITVSEYRSALGLPTDASHDIYLRDIRKVAVPKGATGIEEAALAAETHGGGAATAELTGNAPDGSSVPPADAAPPKGRVPEQKDARHRRYQEHVTRSRNVVQREASRELVKAFGAIADDVVAKVKAHKSAEMLAVVGHSNGHGETKLGWPSFLDGLTGADVVPDGLASARITGIFSRVGQRIGDFIAGATNALLGSDVSAPDALVKLALARADALNADQQTRDAVDAALADGKANGDSLDDLTARIHDYVEGAHLYPGIAADQGVAAAVAYRADVIAATELTVFTNTAIALTAQEAGADGLLCSDGDGCGVTDHDDPEMADGRIFTFDEAQQYPLAHPNCVRSFTPHVGAA